MINRVLTTQFAVIVVDPTTNDQTKQNWPRTSDTKLKLHI